MVNTELQTPAGIAVALAALGLAVNTVGALAARGFARRPAPRPAPQRPISILKPLCGAEPLLEEALEGFCRLDYPDFQLVLGVQDPADPALSVVARVVERWPALDVTVVIDPALHGPNRKISNLINMLPSARHDVLVFSDSDLHVPPDYLRSLNDALAEPGVGLVTTLSTGLPGGPSLVTALGCMQISHCFLPGVLIGRLMGRQDCLGTTMALHRRTLGRVGGLRALLDHLADDQVLGRRVRALGLSVGLAPVVTATTVGEARLGALWAHELRWARTIAGLEPVEYFFSALSFPLFWAGLAVACSGGSGGAVLIFALVWMMRSAGVAAVGLAIRDAPGRRRLIPDVLLLPLRDTLSVAVIAASYCGNRVRWRGHFMRADDGGYRVPPRVEARPLTPAIPEQNL